MQSNPNQMLQTAYQAFASARHADAHRQLDRIDAIYREQPDSVHLRALVFKAEGRHDQSETMFATAHRLRPGDPQILTNWGNLRSDNGDPVKAIDHYDHALRLDPSFTEAQYNRALALHRLGRLDEALDAFDALAQAVPGQAKVHGARGAVLVALERPHAAIKAFDRALAIDPTLKVALNGRARMALETGEANPVSHYIAALQRSAGDRSLILGVVHAMLAEGDTAGLEVLHDVVRQDPSWIEGLHELAVLRAEVSDDGDFAAPIREAIANTPADPALYQALAAVQSSAERYDEALAVLNDGERACGDQPDWAFELARLEGETGQWDQAWTRLNALPDIDLAREVRGRLALRMGRADEAAQLLEGLVDRSPASVPGWAYLSLAWRLTGDPRHSWLVDQPGLWGTRALSFDDGQLERLATVLRDIHRSQSHPVGQSLRGGTQTRGRLFWRGEPELRALAADIERCIVAFMAGLPGEDARHPMLRHAHRSLTLAGSWSVRLLDQGFHVSHIHPQGVLSSACYIVVPPVQEQESRQGWLEIGSAPAELKLGLEPLAVIEPQPGRVALFPSYLFHGTRPFAHGERLTVAFDSVI